ncbi:hypothetical protein CRN66_00140 [Brucella canis]|nr:hypothetical protein CRN66_00140 [Brucella canis]
MFWLRMSAAAVFFTALLPYCPTALLPYCPTALLPYCPTHSTEPRRNHRLAIRRPVDSRLHPRPCW